MPTKKHWRFRERLIKNETYPERVAFDILTGLGLYVEKQKMRRARREDKTRIVYFIDLYIPDYALGIEIDGGFHGATTTHDTNRDLSLMRFGSQFLVIRFTNEQVLNDREYFVKTVREALARRMYQMNQTDWGDGHLNLADYRIEHRTWSPLFKEVFRRMNNENDFYIKEKLPWGKDFDNPTHVFEFSEEKDLWELFPVELIGSEEEPPSCKHFSDEPENANIEEPNQKRRDPWGYGGRARLRRRF